MAVENTLYFRRIHIEAEADDHVLAASDNKEIAVLDPCEIAGAEPAVADDRSGLLRRLVVATHDSGALHPKLSCFAGCYLVAVRVDESCLDAGKNAANGTIAA